MEIYRQLCGLCQKSNVYVKKIFKRINSSPPSATYMRRWTGSALLQMMACRPEGAKLLSEEMLTYCQLDPKEHISMKFYLKFNFFHSWKCVWKCRLRNGGHLSRGTWIKVAFFLRSLILPLGSKVWKVPCSTDVSTNQRTGLYDNNSLIMMRLSLPWVIKVEKYDTANNVTRQ